VCVLVAIVCGLVRQCMCSSVYGIFVLCAYMCVYCACSGLFCVMNVLRLSVHAWWVYVLVCMCARVCVKFVSLHVYKRGWCL